MNRKAIFMLLLLVFSLPINTIRDVSYIELQDEAGWASEASKHWFSSVPISSQQTSLNSLNPLIPSPYGEFNPLIQDSPVPKLEIGDSENLAILQLSTNNGELIYELEENYDFIPLERISTTVWIIKKTSSHDVFSQLEQDATVRWIDNLALGWKLHPSLYPMANVGTMGALVILSPEMDEEDIGIFERDLSEKGIEIISCGITDCQIRIDETKSNQLEILLLEDRILWIEPSVSYVLTNAQASEQSGVQALLSDWNSGLNGSGETVSIVDTGLDMDHSDIVSQLIAVQNGFGLDNNPADSISGHGTHVAGTLLGDGSGESEAVGIAPAAILQMYQLEHNQQGVIGRIGSIYNIMQDAYDNNARFQSTSWVSENAGGQYNGDSRSADKFLWNNRDFIAIYSAGNNGSNGQNTVAAPSTAKNAISVGASTDANISSVASFSGQGPTFDGRIKPDLVAPGENICSSRAQEASSSAGVDCTGAFHADGTTPLHTSLSGASQATPVVSGAAVLTRQYLREELGIISPGSDLIRAILVHGAEDLGAPDVPNPLEGWGKLNLENSLYPTHSGVSLNTWFDDSQTLDPGRMFIYAYNLDSISGLDVTLAWNDEDVASSSLQTSPKLLNDLDLVVIAPNGSTYLGNDFINGVSREGGLADNLNNLERIRINPTQSPSTGVWQIQVHHRGGNSQPFSLVVTGLGQEESTSDLSSIMDSLWISETTPMVNTGVLVRASWANQANLITGNYQVSVTDLTTGEIIISETVNPLAGGGIDSIQATHTFTVTGNHDLQLIIDVADEVNELNENNNFYNSSFIVAAEGVRLEMLNLDGSIDVQREYSIDPFNETSIDLNFRLEHQGTETENIQFSVLSIRAVDETTPIYTLPTTDTWSTSLNLSNSIISMPPDGSPGSIIEFTLNLENLDADLSSSPKYYPSAEKLIVEVVSSYINDSLVTDSLSFTVDIAPIADLNVIISGTGVETASPGEWAKFSETVVNLGNAPVTFELSCTTQSNWEVRVGRDSVSNLYELERLEQGNGVQTDILVRIPTVVAGLPSLNQLEEVYCTVVDTAGTIEGYDTTLTINVGAQSTFNTVLYDELGQNILPALYNPRLGVMPSQHVNLTLNIENTGNIILDLDLELERSETDWDYNLYFSSSDVEMDSTSFSVQVATSVTIRIEIIVPNKAVLGTFNDIEIKVALTSFVYSLNTTRLDLEELPEMQVIQYDQPCNAVAGKDVVCTIIIQNTGNVDLPLIWPLSSSDDTIGQTAIIVPDGWFGFLSNTPGVLMTSEQKTIKLYLQTNSSISVDTTDIVTVKSTSQLPSGEIFVSELDFDVKVSASTVVDFSLFGNDEIALEDSDFFDLDTGSEYEFLIKAKNIGNYPGTLVLEGSDDDDWKINCLTDSILIDAGNEEKISCKLLVPDNGGVLTEVEVLFSLTNNLEDSVVELGTLQIRASSPQLENQNSNSFGFSFNMQLILGLVVFCLIILVGLRLRKVTDIDHGEELVESGDGFSSPEKRLDLLMNAGKSDDDIISGGVDSSEIEAALNQSKPSLPTLPGMSTISSQTPPLPAMPTLPKPPDANVFGPPPIPPEGLPPGWTIEQWVHYGHKWLSENKKK